MFGLSAVGLVCVEKRAVLVKQILYYQICVFVVDVCGRERVGWGGELMAVSCGRIADQR